MVLECLWVLVVANGARAACAMGLRVANVTSTTPVALISPVSPRHSIRANPSLAVAIVVLMVLATAALFCCCYLWERQLRLRIDAARTTSAAAAHHPHPHRVGDHDVDLHSSRPQMGPSPSVIVLVGDDVTRAVAWAVPRRISTNSSVASEAAATQPTATTIADHSFPKLAPA